MSIAVFWTNPVILLQAQRVNEYTKRVNAGDECAGAQLDKSAAGVLAVKQNSQNRPN
jgi:hypothetical protein